VSVASIIGVILMLVSIQQYVYHMKQVDYDASKLKSRVFIPISIMAVAITLMFIGRPA